jgi:hypothetical protein
VRVLAPSPRQSGLTEMEVDMRLHHAGTRRLSPRRDDHFIFLRFSISPVSRCNVGPSMRRISELPSQSFTARFHE